MKQTSKNSNVSIKRLKREIKAIDSVLDQNEIAIRNAVTKTAIIARTTTKSTRLRLVYTQIRELCYYSIEKSNKIKEYTYLYLTIFFIISPNILYLNFEQSVLKEPEVKYKLVKTGKSRCPILVSNKKKIGIHDQSNLDKWIHEILSEYTDIDMSPRANYFYGLVTRIG
jgi:hypothetical protein